METHRSIVKKYRNGELVYSIKSKEHRNNLKIFAEELNTILYKEGIYYEVLCLPEDREV